MQFVPGVARAWSASTRTLQTAIGRLATSSASLIALAILLWPKNNWHLEPDKLFAFIVAAATWFVSIFPEQKPSAHDVALFASFQRLISPDWITWLRRHDFGGSFRDRRATPVFEIDHKWEGAAYVFDDLVLKTKFEPLLAQLVAFAHLIAMNTWPIGDRTMQTAVPGGEDEYLQHEHVRKRVKSLNEASAALADAIDDFVIVGRKRLNVAPQPVAMSSSSTG